MRWEAAVQTLGLPLQRVIEAFAHLIEQLG